MGIVIYGGGIDLTMGEIGLSENPTVVFGALSFRPGLSISLPDYFDVPVTFTFKVTARDSATVVDLLRAFLRALFGLLSC